jgi:hypothetical protein
VVSLSSVELDAMPTEGAVRKALRLLLCVAQRLPFQYPIGDAVAETRGSDSMIVLDTPNRRDREAWPSLQFVIEPQGEAPGNPVVG